MIKAKQVNIKKNKYSTININDLDPFNLDIKKQNSSKDIDIYYIKYIQENLNSSNPLHIKIDSATGYLKKNDDKYLILDSAKEYESAWSEIRSEIKIMNGGEKVFSKKIIVKSA